MWQLAILELVNTKLQLMQNLNYWILHKLTWSDSLFMISFMQTITMRISSVCCCCCNSSTNIWWWYMFTAMMVCYDKTSGAIVPAESSVLLDLFESSIKEQGSFCQMLLCYERSLPWHKVDSLCHISTLQQVQGFLWILGPILCLYFQLDERYLWIQAFSFPFFPFRFFGKTAGGLQQLESLFRKYVSHICAWGVVNKILSTEYENNTES